MADSPNVIVFLTDQQRWDSTGLHGNPLDLTPNLDRDRPPGNPRRELVHLPASLWTRPICPANRALSDHYRVFSQRHSAAGRSANPGRLLQQGGLPTGYIGKWHLADEEPVPEGKRGGYQSWLASNLLEFTSEPYRLTMSNELNQAVTLPGYRADAQTDAAIDFVNANKADPFFLFCSYLEPHHQNRLDDYPAPDGYRARYESRWIPPDLLALGGSTHQHLAGYWGMIKRLDEAYGRLLDALKSLDLLDNTIVLFTSDHGCHFKTRNSEYKRSCHESSIRVPTVFTGPGFFGGGEIAELVSLIDLPPTLLDAAGIPVPSGMQGRSFMPLLRGQRGTDWPGEVYIQISESRREPLDSNAPLEIRGNCARAGWKRRARIERIR